MNVRVEKGIGAILDDSQVAIPGINAPAVPVKENAEYGVDAVTDDAIESQYINPEDKLKESYIEQVGRETGITADIQNIDTKILATYKMLEGPSDDIFNDPNLSDAEKVAMHDGRIDIALNRITNLGQLQQGKIKEINDLAESEATKQREKQAALKSAMELNESLLKTEQFNADRVDADREFALDAEKFNAERSDADRDFGLKANEFNLSASKFELDQDKFDLDKDKFSVTEADSSPLVVGDFSSLGVGGKYGNWSVTQTYGTSSVLGVDNVKLANGQTGTPGVDLAGTDGDVIGAFAGGTVVKVVNGEGNYGVGAGKKVGYGNQVIVKDTAGNLHYYNHLQEGAVKVGQTVQKGSTLGYMGNSGSSTGTHLDYRVGGDKGWLDPRTYMNKKAPKKTPTQEEAAIEYNTVDEYIEGKSNAKGGTIVSKMTATQATNVFQSDMETFKLTSADIKSLSSKFDMAQDPLVIKYNLERVSVKQFGEKTGDALYSNVKSMLGGASDGNLNGILTALVYSGKIDDDLFSPGFFNDAKGWDLLQEYYPDISKDRITEIKSQLSSSEIGLK